MIDRAPDSTRSFEVTDDQTADPNPSSVSGLKAVGFAAKHSFSNLKRFEFERAPAKPNEVELDILFCGVCHSDIHQVKNEWSNTVYPCLPGHEIVGRITRVGSAVTQHRVGDLVGVGCMIDRGRHGEVFLNRVVHGANSPVNAPLGWQAPSTSFSAAAQSAASNPGRKPRLSAMK